MRQRGRFAKRFWSLLFVPCACASLVATPSAAQARTADVLPEGTPRDGTDAHLAELASWIDGTFVDESERLGDTGYMTVGPRFLALPLDEQARLVKVMASFAYTEGVWYLAVLRTDDERLLAVARTGADGPLLDWDPAYFAEMKQRKSAGHRQALRK